MRLMIFDGNSIAWTTGYSVAHFSYRQAKTGVVYGFLKAILSYFRKYDATTAAIVWDAGKSFRKEIFPDYKKARKELTDDERVFRDQVLSQVSTIQNLLKDLNFVNSFGYPGLEGDDLIASLTLNYMNKPNTDIYIVSGDSDLYQLLRDNVHIVSPRDSDTLITKTGFVDEYGIDPTEWVLVKAIAGDTSDSIPGVKGVGISRAIKYLKGEMKESSAFYKRIKESTDLIERNIRLVKLPFEGTPSLTLKRASGDLLTYIRFLQDYGMNSLMKKEQLETAKRLFRLK